MSPRLDLPLAVMAWLVGFAWVARGGSWAPLALLAIALAARLLLLDPATRRLLAFRRRHLLLGAAGAATMVVSTYVLYPLLSAALPSLPGATAGLYEVLNRDGYRTPVLAAFVLIISAAEEIVWRGRTLSGASSRSVPALLGVSLLYGASHLTAGAPLLALLAAICGLFWSVLRVTSGSLWPALLTHALWDLSVLVFRPLS